MNREEALLLLDLKTFDEEAIEDAWEEKFFKEKQFFLSRVPIQKVFSSHLEKLDKLESVYLFLTETTKNDSAYLPPQDFNPSELDSILNAQTKLKIHIANAQSLAELEVAVSEIIKLEKAYCQWVLNTFQSEFSNNQQLIIPLSQKPDIMDFKAVITTYQKLGKINLTQNQTQLIENELARVKKWLTT